MTSDDDVRARKAAYQRAWRASHGARTGQPGPQATQPCGTVAAYRRHQRRGETPCDACRMAWAKQQRDLYRKRVANRRPPNPQEGT